MLFWQVCGPVPVHPSHPRRRSLALWCRSEPADVSAVEIFPKLCRVVLTPSISPVALCHSPQHRSRAGPSITDCSSKAGILVSQLALLGAPFGIGLCDHAPPVVAADFEAAFEFFTCDLLNEVAHGLMWPYTIRPGGRTA